MSTRSARNRMGNARLTASNSSFMEALEVGTLSAQLRERKHADYNRMFMGFLFALFLVALLFSIVTGAHVYRVLSADQVASNDDRLAQSLLVNDIRANDSIDAIARGEGPEGPSLVLVERLESGNFETRIYGYDGDIVQEYTMAGEPYKPASATPIVKSRTFDFSYSDGLVTLTTDEGISHVAIRCVGRAA